MTIEDRVRAWDAAHAAAGMVGWSFARLDGRLSAEEPDWDFAAECREAMASASRVVDLGTGGGERFVELVRGVKATPGETVICATEGWEPNVPVAQRNLEPLGVQVYHHDSEADEPLPHRSRSRSDDSE